MGWMVGFASVVLPRLSRRNEFQVTWIQLLQSCDDGEVFVVFG